jgi:hypothetical protein
MTNPSDQQWQARGNEGRAGQLVTEHACEFAPRSWQRLAALTFPFPRTRSSVHLLTPTSASFVSRGCRPQCIIWSGHME